VFKTRLISLHKFLISIVALSLLFSCSREKSADVGKQKPSAIEKGDVSRTPEQQGIISSAIYALEITPSEGARNAIFYLNPSGFTLSDAKIEWLVNGSPVVSPEPTRFIAAETSKGDTVRAKALIQDREIFSNTVTIKNAPPELTKVKLMPEVFKIGDRLYIDASASDMDEDPVTILYEWTKNGEPAGNRKQIGTSIKRGDKVSIKITPFDGEDYGRSIILHREIRNLPPMIIEDKKCNFDGNVYTYQIKATDPDNDPLTYSLKSAPQGMTIDPSTGLIKWDVPPEFKGKTPITVSVTDGHGGEALQIFTIEIRPEQREITK